MADSTVPCCAQSDAASRKACPACGGPMCRFCGIFAQGSVVCSHCKGAGGRPPLNLGETGTAGLLRGVMFGAGAALASGLVWAGIAIFLNLEIGYAAVGVGWLAAFAVVAGFGRTGFVPQIVSISCALFGLVVGKYLIVVDAVKDHVGKSDPAAADQIAWVSGSIVSLFVENFGSFLGPYDALWALFALLAAWKTAGDRGGPGESE